MAEGIDLASGNVLPSFNFDAVMQTGSAVADVLTWMFIGLFVMALLYGCLYLLSFKHKVRVRQQTGSGMIVIDTKAREFKTKDGLTRWRLLKYIKQSISAPENDYVEFTEKGKLSAECERSRDGTITWRKRNPVDGLPDKLTSEERTMTMAELRRAEDYRKKNTLDKILTMAPIMFTLIILIIMFAFWSEITEGTNLVAAQNQASSAAMAEAMTKLSDAYARAYPELIPRNNTIGVTGQPFNQPPN